MDSFAGLFLPQSQWCEFRCEFLRPLAAHDPLLRVQHDLPHGFGVDLLVRGQQRLGIPPPSRRRDVLHGVPPSARSPTSAGSSATIRAAVVLALRAERPDAATCPSSPDCKASPDSSAQETRACCRSPSAPKN